MAATETEHRTQLQNGVELLDNQLSVLTVATDEDAHVQALEGRLVEQKARGAALFRSRLAAAFGAASILLGPILQDYVAEIVQKPAANVQQAIDHLYDHFQDNYITLQGRGFTFATPGSFSGTKGHLYRLTEDENAWPLEAATADKKILTCTADAQTGAPGRHEELFRLEGATRGRDFFALAGSGQVRGNLRAYSSRTSLLSNAGFTSYSWATEPSTGSDQTGVSGDSITDWTPGSAITNFQLTVDTVAEQLNGVTTPIGVRYLGNDKLTQALSVGNIQVSTSTPYMLEAWVYRESSCDGNLILRMGATSVTVDMTTLTGSAWNRVALDVDYQLWPAIWNEDQADIEVELSSRTTGTFVLGRVVFAPFFPFDGSWYFLSSGPTPFALDDSINFTDSISSDAKIQKWLVYAFGRYLPAAVDATQITASGGRTLTFANSGGTVTASSGSFITDGYKAGMVLTVASSLSNDGTYTITAVTATVITVSESITDEGPVSATTTLDAGPTIADPT